MGKISTKENKSIYQITREELGLSREEVADILSQIDYDGFVGRFSYFTADRLSKLELEKQQFQPEDILALSLAYNKPELRNYYCCNNCPIGEKDAPQVIDASNVHKTLVEMAVSLESVNNKKIRLMEILRDEKIDNTEKEDMKKILDELEKISMSIEAIQLWCEKIETDFNDYK